MSDFTALFFFALVITIIVPKVLLSPKFDRKRIKAHLESCGGHAISIEKQSSIFGDNSRSYDRTYNVTYETSDGKKISSTCKTSRWNGVYWISQIPPGFPAAGLFNSDGPLNVCNVGL